MSSGKAITCKVKMAYIGAPCDMLYDFNLPFSTLQPEIKFSSCAQMWTECKVLYCARKVVAQIHYLCPSSHYRLKKLRSAFQLLLK